MSMLRFNFAEQNVDAICDKVRTFIKDKVELEQIQKYLQRTLTLSLVEIRLNLIEHLKQIPAIAQLEQERNFITSMVYKAPEIYTMMWARNCDYDSALALVNKGQQAKLIDALESIAEAFKPGLKA